jgi:hypothetical protein
MRLWLFLILCSLSSSLSVLGAARTREVIREIVVQPTMEPTATAATPRTTPTTEPCTERDAVAHIKPAVVQKRAATGTIARHE